VVRDPPRKSEQACRVRCSWDRRAQPRRPSKCGPCIERRQRNGRRQRHRLWIHRTQRERLRRILGNAASCPDGPERSRRPIRARRWSNSGERLPPCSRLRITNTYKHERWYVQTRRRRLGFERKAVGYRKGCQLRHLRDFESYFYGNIVCTWLSFKGVLLYLDRLTCNISDGISIPLLKLGPQIRYLFCSRIDHTLALVICNTM
jgi:hypothetical protein